MTRDSDGVCIDVIAQKGCGIGTSQQVIDERAGDPPCDRYLLSSQLLASMKFGITMGSLPVPASA